jgi:hypothetical protein
MVFFVFFQQIRLEAGRKLKFLRPLPRTLKIHAVPSHARHRNGHGYRLGDRGTRIPGIQGSEKLREQHRAKRLEIAKQLAHSVTTLMRIISPLLATQLELEGPTAAAARPG